MSKPIGGSKQVAAGPAGGLAATRFTLAEIGPTRAARLLAVANKPKGFDCPGCAWPESDKTHAAEFFEKRSECHRLVGRSGWSTSFQRRRSLTHQVSPRLWAEPSA